MSRRKHAPTISFYRYSPNSTRGLVIFALCFCVVISISWTFVVGIRLLLWNQQETKYLPDLFLLFSKEQHYIPGLLRNHHGQNENNVIKNLCPPSNIHLSPTGNVNLESSLVNVTVSFTLPDHEECRPSLVTPIVWYGCTNNTMDDDFSSSFTFTSSPSHHTTPEESFQFSFSGYFQSFTSSFIHHTVLVNLQGGNELYWYYIDVVPNSVLNMPLDSIAWSKKDNSAKETNHDSRIFHFMTTPLPNNPVRIAMVADWGGTDEAIQTMNSMVSRRNIQDETGSHQLMPPLSAVIVAGDVSYANSHLPSWEEWLTKMEPLYSTTPLLVAAGNHEIECNRKTWQVFEPYESYFRVPNRIAEAHIEPIPSQLQDCTHPAQFMTKYWYGNSFYSYRHGLLQIVVLNSYTNTTKGSVQYQWLKQELETNIDRTITPWLLIVFHCPFHTTFRGHNDERNPKLMMQDMEPLFVKHGVNLVLSGHNHAYVRTVPMKGLQPNPRGPIYLTIGTGGDSHSQGPLHPDHAEAWVAHRDHSEFGYGELHVVNATHAYFQRILNNNMHHARPEAQDAFWIRNKVHLTLLKSQEQQQLKLPTMAESEGIKSYAVS